ncbi:unnamed protein product [Rodentolepis nana]|uniref:Secreted protein n=1 Tax=Rodentolepis nana TaxID=102285 RepID=A0A0R3TJ25_RODNA|nr:unnamed protein product [Rodentolepis nana]
MRRVHSRWTERISSNGPVQCQICWLVGQFLRPDHRWMRFVRHSMNHSTYDGMPVSIHSNCPHAWLSFVLEVLCSLFPYAVGVCGLK